MTEKWYFVPRKFTAYEKKSGSRCGACGEMIRYGDSCLKFKQEQVCEGEPDEAASLYLCLNCGESMFSAEAKIESWEKEWTEWSEMINAVKEERGLRQ